MIHFYKRCVSSKVVYQSLVNSFFRAKESLLKWYLITWMGYLFLQFYTQVLNPQLFQKFCHRWQHMYNHKRTLFIVCLHKVLKKTFWSWYSQLYSANPILFKYYIIRFFSLDPSGFNEYSNEMRNLFCSIFWILSSSNCLNDQANTCLIHFYKRCVSLKAVILIIG